MLSRDILNALWPEGSFWTPAAEDEDYDNLLEGIAENTDEVYSDLSDIRNFRCPKKTILLSDLENEFAIRPTATATETERRDRLAITMFKKVELPTHEKLQGILRDSGFDVYVYANDPAVDPDTFLDENFNMVCNDLLPGGNDPQCDEAEAICARVGGELLVNGEFYEQSPNYSILCDEALAQCDEALAYAGQYDGVTMIPIEYEVPADGGYWPMIFFIGGEVTRNMAGEITDINIASIPIERRMDFRRLILRHKVMGSWAALIVIYQ